MSKLMKLLWILLALLAGLGLAAIVHATLKLGG